MNTNIKFYPIGNGDCTLFKLDSGKTLLFDFADRNNIIDKLNDDITYDYVDVVSFSHGDSDHVGGFENYFFLEHAVKYQNGSRKKILDLWVPAHAILEEGCDDSTRILRAEARYRLKNKKGIKVFSKPGKLKSWLEKENIDFESVKHLIVDAGKLVPGWDSANTEVEFFTHAPFSYSADGIEVNRNDACIVLQARFKNSYNTEMLLLGDADWQVITHIVEASKRFSNDDRLYWDICHISHHCSYLSLSPEKGKEVTHPVAHVKELLEQYGKEKCVLVSPSNPIPLDYDAIQPPHRQAYKYYKAVADTKSGEIFVTMEFPTTEAPMPIEIVINNYGITVLKEVIPAAFTYNQTTPKAG
jgi:hypothetical protein